MPIFEFILVAALLLYVSLSGIVEKPAFLAFSLSPGQFGFAWLIVGILFLLIEIATPGLFFFVAFAVGAGAAGLVSFAGVSFVEQCGAFLVGSCATFFLLKRLLVDHQKHKPKTNIQALVGREGVVTQTILPHSSGRVRVDREEWSAKIIDDASLQTGTIVSILHIRGNHLIVKNVNHRNHSS